MERCVWLSETARDIVALGSLPFFVLVLARVWMLENMAYLFQFVFAGAIFGLLFFYFKQDVHAGLGLIILVFTSFYYKDFMFGIFGVVIYCLLIGSLVYLGKDLKKVGLGVLIGIFGVGVSFIYPKL